MATHTAFNRFIPLLLGLILIWAPIPLGSNRIWAWSVLHSLIALTVMLHCIHAFKAALPLLRASWMKLFLAIPALASGYMLLQGLQLIPGIQSADPYQSLMLAQRSLFLLLFIWLLCQYISTVAQMQTLVLALVISGCLQATYGSMINLAGLELSPVFAVAEAERARGSFGYQNHFANYLALCLSLAIGWIVSELATDKQPGNTRARLRAALATMLSTKLILRLAVIVMIIGLILSRSRMGNSAFFIALAVTALLAIFYYKNPPRLLKPLVISIFVLDLVIVGAMFGVEKVQQRLLETSFSSESRDEVVRDSLPLLQQHWLTGTGAGSFYTVFPAHQRSLYTGFYDHAHNDYLQFAIELGIPMTLLLGAWQLYALWLCLQTMRRRNTRFYKGIAFGSMMANLHMLLHNTVDFNLQAPANALLFVTILALSHLAYYNSAEQQLAR
ncbi:O-antigen polymerase [Arsukibacterium ikkense]|uniref:O-antigen polymerase n=2 Tax=Arsukibacterium ikkense TaxID=336831 RepID=A0A0M2V871_9GAMM|nr:O-antigen polymerase [Arsukibacterium ikkense]